MSTHTIITTCALCTTEFDARTSYGLCKNCWSRDRLREWDRLETAKKHVRRTGVPITITLVEWLSILSDFQGHCAYCLVQPYSSIEMVKPHKGLVRDNVVPACRACQVHKQHGFDAALERVQAYVESEPTIHFFEDVPEMEEITRSANTVSTKRRMDYDMDSTIPIDADYFEHLLNCLANQKFIHDVNADGLAEGEDAVRAMQARNQHIIDEAYHKGRDLLMEWIREHRPELPVTE